MLACLQSFILLASVASGCILFPDGHQSCSGNDVTSIGVLLVEDVSQNTTDTALSRNSRSVVRNSVTPSPGHALPFGIWGRPGALFVSQVAVAGVTAFDVASSRGMEERNPLLGRGPFGERQASIEVGLTAISIIAENLIVSKWPRMRRPLTYFNLGHAGVKVGIAAHNLSQR